MNTKVLGVLARILEASKTTHEAYMMLERYVNHHASRDSVNDFYDGMFCKEIEDIIKEMKDDN